MAAVHPALTSNLPGPASASASAPGPARVRHRHSLAVLVLAATCLVTGCRSKPRALVVDSDPPGALVLLDGEDTGYATPCVLDLSRSKVRSVELQLAGYRPERRVLREGEWTQAVLWRDMTIGISVWHFPLFLPPVDVFFPMKENDGEMPNRIHARLVRETGE